MSTNKYQFSLIEIESEQIKKVIDVSSLILALVLLCTSAVMIVASSMLKLESDIATMSLFSVGAIVAIFSIYQLFNKVKRVVYTPTTSPIKHYFCCIEPSQLVQVEKWAESGFKYSCGNFQKRDNSNVRIDACISSDEKFAAVQLSVYDNFLYVSHHGVTYLFNDDVKYVSAMFKE